MRVCILSVAMALILPMWVSAHGTLGAVDQAGGVLISASYDDGDPMSYAEVTILVEGRDIPFQTGRTDKNGRFMVFSKDAGNYKAVIKDGMGHGLTLMLPSMDEGASDPAPSNSLPPPSRRVGLLTGLSAIFFVSGLGFWWAGRRQTAH